MNARQAQDAGYVFTGIYSWDHKEVKARAAELRKQGNKALTIYEPASKYSRSSSGGGYSVYWIESEKNKAIRLDASRKRQIENLKRQAQELRNQLAEVELHISELEK